MNLKEAKTEMTLSSLFELLQLLESNSIPVWLDGGWGIDALIQTQTRTHQDVDIISICLGRSETPRTLGKNRVLSPGRKTDKLFCPCEWCGAGGRCTRS